MVSIVDIKLMARPLCTRHLVSRTFAILKKKEFMKFVIRRTIKIM
jgi:hypothetical protein